MLRRPADLINRTWPWLPLALLALAVVWAAGSIATMKPVDAVTQVNRAVHGYARAAVAGRGVDACRRLSPRAQQQITAPVSGQVSCSVALRSFGAPFSAAALQYVSLRDIRFAGRRAAVAPDDVRGPRGDPAGLGLSFVKVGSKWRLDAVRPAPARGRRRAAAAARP